jgi:hypothetical protein
LADIFIKLLDSSRFADLREEIGGEFVICLGLRGGLCFDMYIVYFAFPLHLLRTHLSHLASPVILTCICLIMLITVLG